MIATNVLDTPIGPLSLLVRDTELVGAGFTADPRELYLRLHRSLRPAELTAAGSPVLTEISAVMTAYFAGDLDAMDRISVHQPGTPVRERLWTALRAVPAGTTVTYGELAVKAGLARTAARVAGGACAANLVAPMIPCHRIVPAGGGLRGGGLGGYYYGLDRKDWLLRHESG